MAFLAEGDEEKKITYQDTVLQPRSVITSPEWSGSEHRRSPLQLPFARQRREAASRATRSRAATHFYLDHDWMHGHGRGPCRSYRPPLDLAAHLRRAPRSATTDPGQPGQAEVAVRYLTIHNKWAIHSQYYDNPYMLTLGRGGQTVWMSPQDAEKIGVRDNEWIEAKNRNGTVSARAVVSHRIPEGTVFMHHAQDRQINTPLNEGSGKRGGTHNSLTRIFIKPTHLAGGYAQFAYAFNYYGPTGNNRDERHGYPPPLPGGAVLMKVMAQIAMVMNLDKCIGCHTCSVTCKQVWTNRDGTEYIWFNNVETRPGVGYPRGWEDQKKWKGGWKRTATGRLVPRQGGTRRLAREDLREPDAADHEGLLRAVDLRVRQAAPGARELPRDPDGPREVQDHGRAHRQARVGPELGR